MRSNQPKGDLEERTLQFARDVRKFVNRLPWTMSNNEDAKQVVQSSGSIGANYIEANESLGRKDFHFRLKIARKEAKETFYWLHLLSTGTNKETELERQRLLNEAKELRCILSSIILKVGT
jgi:four helix bundle protein